MMKKTMLVCCFALVSACATTDGYDEINEGRTAEVYACGDWQIEQIDQISAAVDDWNAGITLASGEAPYHFGGVIPEEDTYEESDIGDGFHCVYRVYENYPTAYGRGLWQNYHVNRKKSGIFDDNDDIVIFGTDVCSNPELPEGWSCTWVIQNTVTHELGHAGGLGHASDDTDSVMKAESHSLSVTAYDRQNFCDRNGCL